MAAIYNDICLADGITKRYGTFTLQYYAATLARDLKLSREFLQLEPGLKEDSPHNERRDRIASRLASFDSVAGCVFATYEVLEMILLRLPMRDMLVVSRVNKTFDAIIRRSLSIQRALYLVPNPVPTCQLKLLSQETRHFALARCSKAQLGPWKPTSNTIQAVLESEGKPCYTLDLQYELAEDFCSRLKPLELHHIPYPQGSWRAMLLSQPLCDRVRVQLCTKGGKCVIEDTVVENGAMTMGEVQDWLQATYTATVASEDWRLFVDEKDTFKKNVDTIVP